MADRRSAKKPTLEEHAAKWREKHGETGISSELYRAVMAGEVEFPTRSA